MTSVMFSPFGITVGFLKDIVTAVYVHDTVLEMKLPSVTTPRNLRSLQENVIKMLNMFKGIVSPCRTDTRPHYQSRKEQKGHRQSHRLQS